MSEIDQWLDAYVHDPELLDFALSAIPEPDRTELSAGIAVQFLSRFERMGLIEDFNPAIPMKKQVVTSANEEHPNRTAYITTYISSATVFPNQCEGTGRMYDLDEMVTMNDKEGTSAADDTTGLINLGKALQLRFERTGSMDDLNQAIATNELAVAFTSKNDPNRATCLHNLAVSLQTRFQCTGSKEDLDRALKTTEQAVASTTDDHPNRATYLANLGVALQRRFDCTGSMDDLDRSVTTFEKAVTSTTNDDPDRALCLCNLGTTLHRRFLHTRSKEDLSRAVTAHEQAIASTDGNHPNRATMLTNLGSALRCRFEWTGSKEDLSRAVTTHEQAIASTDGNHPNRARTLAHLGSVLKSRFEWTGSMDDLDRAITANEQAVACTTNDSPWHARYLSNLGSTLLRRFDRKGWMDDLDLAIIMNEQAVASTPYNDPSRAGMLTNLGNALDTRFSRTGSMDDLNRAIQIAEQAVTSAEDDPKFMICLANSLESRFQRTGSIDDLDRAIAMNEKAVASTPDSHSNRAQYLNNLGNTLRIRFEQMNSMDDIDRAITVSEQAVISTPDEHLNRAMYLNNLGGALQRRYERMGSMHDLDRAITMIEQAVAITADDHPNRSMYLNNLGLELRIRFKQTGSIDDLDRAIMISEQAVASTPDNHPRRVGHLTNLGNALQSRFIQTGLMDDLHWAIMTKEQAVASVTDDDPKRAMYLDTWGNALQIRFERTKSMDDLDRAITMKEQAVAIRTAPPSTRIRAANSASKLLVGRDWDRANAILRVAVDLLPMTSPRILDPLDQQYNISQFAGITSRAVSVSLQCGDDPYRALQLSELGNGVLATLKLQVRSDALVLRESHPDLAREFYDLRDELDRPPSKFIHSTENSSHYKVEDRRNLCNKFDTLLARIRQLKGFEQFLLAPSQSDLKKLAFFGPIIVFNVSEIRSDAFIVNIDDICSVSLPLLTNTDLEAYTKRFLSAVQDINHQRHASATQEIHTVLKWLWDVAVSVVLDKLGFTQAVSSNAVWPRVWWVGSGLLNILPIHAAGYHDLGSTKTAIDRVISSYTPTLKALAYARERNIRAASLKSQKALFIGMPETPGPDQRSLPFVSTEIDNLNDLLSSRIQMTVMQNPTRENVLSTLPDQQIVHFACHGYSSPTNPSKSHLLLNDWNISPLTVSDLMLLHIKVPQLAFLSACHSASLRDFRLLGESITLSSAIQLAGYPSVIGTLWNVGDENSAEISKEVYAGMLVENKLDTERSAESLHRAVRGLRDRTCAVPGFKRKVPNDPVVWAPYIHIGV